MIKSGRNCNRNKKNNVSNHFQNHNFKYEMEKANEPNPVFKNSYPDIPSNMMQFNKKNLSEMRFNHEKY